MEKKKIFDKSETTIEEGLRKVKLKAEYNTEDDNIIRDLYAPCLQVSKR